MTRLTTLAVLSAVLAPAALGQSDNFDDNAVGPQWATVIDNPSQLTLAEQNGRVEALANFSTASTNDALYLSTGVSGFTLSTADDFEIALNYSVTGFTAVGGTGSATALVFGVGRDLDGTDSAAVAFGPVNLGFATASALGVAYRIDDAQTDTLLGTGPSAGTFVIAYDADDLTLGVGASTFTLADTVQAVWGADQLLVSLGVRGRGFNLATGDAWLDDFTIRSGTVIPIPEPAVALVALAALLLRRRRGYR